MNELEESWNKYKKELIARNHVADVNDRTFFQAGFNAAAKLFRKSNTTQQCSGQETPVIATCSKCGLEHHSHMPAANCCR